MIWLFHLLVSCSVCLWTGSSVTHPMKVSHSNPPSPMTVTHTQTHPHPPPSVSPWLISLFLQSGFLSFHHSIWIHLFKTCFFKMVPKIFFFPSITLNSSFKFTQMILNRFYTIPFHPVLCLLFGKEFRFNLRFVSFFCCFFFWLDKIKCDTKEGTKGVNICSLQYGLGIFCCWQIWAHFLPDISLLDLAWAWKSAPRSAAVQSLCFRPGLSVAICFGIVVGG